MTQAEQNAARALSACCYLPASAPKRFVRQLNGYLASNPDKVLTKHQREYLRVLTHSYRRQIGVQASFTLVKALEAEQEETPL